MTNRRTFLASVAGGIALGSAGCLDLITGEDLEYEARQVRVSENTLSETGYEEDELNTVEVEEEFEAAGTSRTVIVTNTSAEYQRTVNVAVLGETEAAVFSAFSSPSVSVLGQEFNPIEDMSTKELVEMVQDQYDDMEDIEHIEDWTATLGDEEVEASTFETEAEFDGQSVDIYLDITEAASIGDDYVIGIGAYPQELEEEAENVQAMMAGIFLEE